METAMSTWNDERLDELSRRTDAGFVEMRQGFARVDAEMKAGFAKVDERFERLNHILLVLIGTILAAALSGAIALLVAL
jgi:hypothetical protein